MDMGGEEMMGHVMNETWANLNVLVREPEKYVSPEEYQRRERVAVGRICRCNSCVCCAELKAELKRGM